MSRTLELNIRVNGNAELLDGDGNQVWVSTGDDNFLDFFDSDFVEEDDLPEVYAYLRDADIITEAELEAFENDSFDVFIEDPDTPDGDDDDPDDDHEDDDADSDYDDDEDEDD